MPGTKKVFVKTFGCQMNVYDSERMAESLIPYGFSETDRPEEAEVIILNTCHIREKAVEKVMAENKAAVADLKRGKQKSLNFLVGQVMHVTRAKANPKDVQNIILKKIKGE